MEDRTAIEGVPADQLADDDLLRELASVHRTRHDTLRHGSQQALAHHDQRTAELEAEYLRRYPRREIDPQRLTVGARARDPSNARSPESVRSRGIRTGAEQPWDPEDLAIAQGRDPTAENLERARRELERDGAAAIERTVPG